MAEWTFVDQRLDDSGRILKHGVILEDAEGNDWTEAVFENPDFQLVVVAYDLEESNPNGLKAVKQVIQDAEALNIPIVLLTSSGEPIIERVLLKHEIEVESLFADDIELKAMIRSNPGLMLMHDGVVLEKWPFRGFPDREKLASYLTP
jgi:CheY-like chemotaxis protein